jgi:hypothetical protein
MALNPRALFCQISPLPWNVPCGKARRGRNGTYRPAVVQWGYDRPWPGRKAPPCGADSPGKGIGAGYEDNFYR